MATAAVHFDVFPVSVSSVLTRDVAHPIVAYSKVQSCVIWVVSPTLRSMVKDPVQRLDYVTDVCTVSLLDDARGVGAVRVECPCCGYFTLCEGSESERCPVCFWVDDKGITGAGGDIGPKVSIEVARLNYLEDGACDRRFLHLVRTPTFLESSGSSTAVQGRNVEECCCFFMIRYVEGESVLACYSVGMEVLSLSLCAETSGGDQPTIGVLREDGGNGRNRCKR